jgi:hypothetical protein
LSGEKRARCAVGEDSSAILFAGNGLGLAEGPCIEADGLLPGSGVLGADDLKKPLSRNGGKALSLVGAEPNGDAPRKLFSREDSGPLGAGDAKKPLSRAGEGALGAEKLFSHGIGVLGPVDLLNTCPCPSTD